MHPGTGRSPRSEACDCHACRPSGPYDQADLASVETVVRHGWQVVIVGSGACECCDGAPAEADGDSGPAFAYTVGLGHRAGHPELLMSGLEPDLMHRALNGLARRVVEGRRLAPGDVVEGVLSAAPVALAPASAYALDEVVTWSGWFHRRPPEALVVVWPTTSGVFPWQPGAPAVLDELQPTDWRDAIALTGALEPDPAWDFPVPPDTRAFTCRHVLEEGSPLLFVARQRDTTRGEDWTLHCGAATHATEDAVVVHLSHIVRGAPSVRAVAHLPLDWEADRDDVDSEWCCRALGT